MTEKEFWSLISLIQDDVLHGHTGATDDVTAPLIEALSRGGRSSTNPIASQSLAGSFVQP